jgi:NADH dehydrogenase [ubiquinone] 1 alpha subcomplex assembly factor 7
MTALAQRLARRIHMTGPISVADYMEEASAAYYAARDPFGAAGDFITAPEVSQIFGELIGLWCVDLWQRLGAPDPVLLVELGPGRGTLMADALRAARVAPRFLAAARLHLVERSPLLRAKQAKTLAADAPQWHESTATLPPGPTLLVANEFLDALPIRQFERRSGAWHERKINLANDGTNLAFCLEAQPSPLSAKLPDAAQGAVVEISMGACAVGETIAARLATQGGGALFVDYGYFPSACGDTLQAVRRHRTHAVLEDPGSADLTAHVDFAAFAHAAKKGGVVTYGPVSQRDFLLRLGLEARRAKLIERATPAQAEAIDSACHRLIHEDAMGSLFKVLALGQKGAPAPAGFAAEGS